MEKKIGSKEVKMQGSTGQPQKLSYEELNQACAEMSQQIQQQNKYIQQLHKQMQEMNFMLQNKRMDYLFRIVEISNKSNTSEYACFDKSFVEECIAEIQESLTIPQEKGKKEETPKED
jgi:methyl-accepting chemotaxis protein